MPESQGAQSFFSLKFDHNAQGFTGMSVLAHAGTGPGKFYSAQVCQDMWTEDGGLSVELCGELKESASILHERDTAGAYTYTYVHVYTYTHIRVNIYSNLYNIQIRI